MGRKKQLSASRRKPSSSAPPSSTVDDIRASKRILAALHNGNHTKAEKMVKKSLSKHKKSPILHRVNSEIHFKLATLVGGDDSNAKLNHLNNSAESAQRATTLSPNSISFSLFYVNILFELSKEKKEYDKVIEECDRGLSIENPIEEIDLNLKSRIENVRNEIRQFKINMIIVKIIDVDREEWIKFRSDVEDQSKRESDLKEFKKKKEEKIKEALDFVSCSTSNRFMEENVNKMEKVRKYWNDVMSDESRKRLLEVRIDDIKQHFDKNHVAREALMEAIGHGKENGTWKFWECCFCKDKFVDCNVGMKHYEEVHEGVLSEKLLAVVPSEVDHVWVDMIENGDWRPVDTLAAMTIIKKQRNVDNEWPLSDDTERAKILERIRCMFKLFLGGKCLAACLTGRMICYAMGKLQDLIPISQLQIYKLDETLYCLRFLEVCELNDALKFLQEVCDICDFTRLPDDDNQVVDIKERIGFSSDFNCLLLDERLLQGELICDMHQNAVVVGDGSAVTSAVDDSKDDVLPISDDIITWLFYSPIEEQLASWTQLREEKHGGTEVFEVLETEFSNLKSMCERKRDLHTYLSSFHEVENICHLEVLKKKQFPESETQSYASLLRERRKKLVEKDGDAVCRSSQFLLDAIRDVLDETLSLSFNEIRFAECGKDDDQMMQDCLDQANYCTQEAIRRQHIRLFDELAKVDAMIMRSVAATQQIKLKLRRMCAYDYRSIMLPLLKSFIQAHLENLVDRDATEKSDAQEACLAELALDAKKSISKGSDHEKQMHYNNKKSKEFKVSGGNEHLLLHQEDAEQFDVPVASVSADELEEQEEKPSHKIEVEEVARKHIAETWEYQRGVDNEAKEKCLCLAPVMFLLNLVTFGMVAVNLTEGEPHEQLNSEVSEASFSYYEKSQQDPLVDEIGIPKASSGVPLNTINGTMGESSSVSVTQWRKKTSHSHDKFE